MIILPLSLPLHLSLSLSLTLFDPDDRAQEKGETFSPSLRAHSETVDVPLCIFNSSAGDGNSAVGTVCPRWSGESKDALFMSLLLC